MKIAKGDRLKNIGDLYKTSGHFGRSVGSLSISAPDDINVRANVVRGVLSYNVAISGFVRWGLS